jgi:kinesin family protein 3/17
MMAMISPALEAFVESLSTLKFANRAKNIKNEARVNEDLDQKSLLRRYERELKRLRAELEERNRNVVDQRRLLELEEQRRRAEEDKMAAIRALEARSREFMREKQEKKRLEERISMLQGQMLMGGAPGGPGGPGMLAGNVQDTPAFRNALKEHQERIRAEYESRLAELEKERETIEEEKAQVDRYKQLLLKQRDIMILLTQRLNERDEQIVALQDELDAYDRHQRELEEKLDEKTAALIHLQRVTMEHNAASPVKNSELVEALGDWAGTRGGKAGGGMGMHGRARAASGGDGSDGALAAGAVPPQLLLTTKQFRAYDEHGAAGASAGAAASEGASSSGSAGGSGGGAHGGGGGGAHGGGGGGSPGAPLLSAEEKIAELARLVDGMRGDRDRLTRELEDVQAEKVSMEYLLREKLEKLVQTEIEARLTGYKKPSAEGGSGSGSPKAAGGAAATPAPVGVDVAAAASAAVNASVVRQLQAELQARSDELAGVRGEHVRAEDELKRLRRKLTVLSEQQAAASGAAASEAAMRQLQDRLALHEKERRAIHTIMEHKIKTLVDAIATVALGLTGGASAAAPPTPGGAATPQARLQREVQALQRLVNASISALRNSEAESGRDGDGSSSVASAASTPAAPTPGGGVPPAHKAAMGSVAAGGLQPQATPLRSAAAATPKSAFAPGAGGASGGSMTVDAMIAARKDELQRQRHSAGTPGGL